eukprot:4858999-Pleurochrysis_carterae.AAC.2
MHVRRHEQIDESILFAKRLQNPANPSISMAFIWRLGCERNLKYGLLPREGASLGNYFGGDEDGGSTHPELRKGEQKVSVADMKVWGGATREESACRFHLCLSEYSPHNLLVSSSSPKVRPSDSYHSHTARRSNCLPNLRPQDLS